MTIIDASAEFGKVNDPYGIKEVSANIDFTASVLNIPRPLAELRQSAEKSSFGNASFAANLVAGLDNVKYVGNEGPRPAGPAQAPGMRA